MSESDRQTRWLRRTQAKISQRRLERFAVRVDKLTAESWWQQIAAAAADLALEPGTPADWQ